MSIYNYQRVSTKEQNTGRQQQALTEYALKENITYNQSFIDFVSGKNFDRPNYKKLKEIIKSGDTIVIKELDRLGRNYMDTPKELLFFFEHGVNVIILDTPLISTGDTKLDYTINNMLIGFLSYIADKEREKIQSRIKEGLQVAKSNNVRLGRPQATLPQDFEKYYTKWKKGNITAIEFSKIIGVSRATLYRYIKQYE